MNFTSFAAVRRYFEGSSGFEDARSFTLSLYQEMSLPEAIAQACHTKELTRDGPKKDQHKRYSWPVLNKCRAALLANQSRLESAAEGGFDSLLRTVGDILDQAGLHGVRELGRYDFALKIGATLDCEPSERVYVHRKPLKVARALHLPIVRGDGQPYVLRSKFPAELASMRADALENLLCNCGDELVYVAERLGHNR
ncbi:MAG TPA: hypothetical protein VE084_22910 [Burkholderiaceae bacterium]|nr:hypothetical protein [Burkholderiaceae bacterium]